MQINIGDLVKCRSHGHKIGIVVDKRPPNEGLSISKHTSHITKVYPSVYYVYFSGEGRQGPYYLSDVVLHQYFRQERSSIDESSEECQP